MTAAGRSWACRSRRSTPPSPSGITDRERRARGGLRASSLASVDPHKQQACARGCPSKLKDAAGPRVQNRRGTF
jgi:hypothetical protein